MELREVLLKRRSVRRFTTEKVDKGAVEQLLHAAMSGPSACNTQPWEFFVITSGQKLEEIRATGRYTGIRAPLCIVVCGNRERMLPPPVDTFWVQDCSAATENILLAAADMGLGSVWCGVYPKEDAVEKVQKTLGVPEAVIPLGIIHIGHPAENPEPRDQYRDELVHFVE